jgi:hypothetical protein
MSGDSFDKQLAQLSSAALAQRQDAARRLGTDGRRDQVQNLRAGTFGSQVANLSSEALELREEIARNMADDARRDRVKNLLISVVVAFMYAIVIFYHREIRDTVARLFEHKEPEYKELLKLADGDELDKDADPAETADPATRKARMRALMKKARDNAATADRIMDDQPEPGDR